MFHQRRTSKVFVLCLLLSSILLIPSLNIVRPVLADSQWWDNSWALRKQIVLNHTMTSNSLVDFPVLVVDQNLRQ